jgi:hypothetical protein
MRFLLRRIASALRTISIYPIGYPRTLSLWRFKYLSVAFIKVILLIILSTLCLGVFGVGIMTIINSYIPTPEIVNTYSYYIFYSLVAWIAVVTTNHIHDVVSLMGNYSWWEFIYVVPAYFSVVVIGPMYDLGCYFASFVIHSLHHTPFNELVCSLEIRHFVMDTIPALLSYPLIYIIMPMINTIDVVNIPWRAYINNWFYIGRDQVQIVVGLFFPDWFSDTMIGRNFLASISSAVLTSLIIKVIIHYIFNW